MIFDGKALAAEIEARVGRRVKALGERPRVVSVVVGSDPASKLYTRLKFESARRCGIEFEVQKLAGGQTAKELGKVVRELGRLADGVMVQLPISDLQGQSLKEVLAAIPVDKDVDGLRWEMSGVKPATVRAVLTILERIADRKSFDHLPLQAGSLQQGSKLWGKRFVVVGGTGAVGRPLVAWLREKYQVRTEVVNSQTLNRRQAILPAEVVISCVGKPGIITGEMVREGVIAIDVGAPRGDMTTEVYQKSSIALPVPGGVGPVTIACLMENIVEMYVRPS